MKNKKGFIFGVIPLIMMILAVALVILLIIFGLRISEGIQTIFTFLTKWWWTIAIAVGVLVFRKQLIAILNAILKRMGVKI